MAKTEPIGGSPTTRKRPGLAIVISVRKKWFE
jgi:hypothetical protein